MPYKFITTFTQSLILMLLFFNLTACSNKSMDITKKNNCSWNSLVVNGENNFCSQPRSSTSDENNIFISFDNGAIVKWNLRSKNVVSVFNTMDTYSKKVILLDNNMIISGSKSMKIQKWSTDGNLIKEKSHSNGTVFNIIKYKDKLYTAFGNAKIGVIDNNNLKKISLYQGHDYLIYALYIDIEKNILCSGSDDNKIIIWKILDNGLLEKIKTIDGFSNSVRNILKLDNSYAVTTGDGNIILFDKNFNDKIYISNEHNGIIVTAKYINDYLLTGDSVGSLHVYKVVGDELWSIKKYNLNSSVRIIEQVGDSIIAISKNGTTIMIDTKALNKEKGNNGYRHVKAD